MPHLRSVLLNSFFLKKLNIYDQNKNQRKIIADFCLRSTSIFGLFNFFRAKQ